MEFGCKGDSTRLTFILAKLSFYAYKYFKKQFQKFYFIIVFFNCTVHMD